MYAILRTKNFNSKRKITQVQEHNLRLGSQSYKQNVDKDKTKLNKVLFNSLKLSCNSASELQEKLFNFYEDKNIKVKEDNVLLFEYVATASPEFFVNKSEEQIQDWAKTQIKFFEKKFDKNLKFAILHRDEKTPHIHFLVSTEQKSVKKYKNQYGEFHKETWSLNSQHINPEFLRELQTEFALANSDYGLKRGEKSIRKHIPTKTFYKILDRAYDRPFSIDYEKKLNKKLDKLEFGIVESNKSRMQKIQNCIDPIIKEMNKVVNFSGKVYTYNTTRPMQKLEEAIKSFNDAQKEAEKEKANYKEMKEEFGDYLKENESLLNEIKILKAESVQDKNKIATLENKLNNRKNPMQNRTRIRRIRS